MLKERADTQKPNSYHFPAGYENLAGNLVPNVAVTNDPVKILTVSFDGGKEIWT